MASLSTLPCSRRFTLGMYVQEYCGRTYVSKDGITQVGSEFDPSTAAIHLGWLGCVFWGVVYRSGAKTVRAYLRPHALAGVRADTRKRGLM